MAIQEDQPLVLEEVAPSHMEAKRRRGIVMLNFAVAAVGFAIMLQMALNDNFLVQDPRLHLNGGQKGVQEAFRESCGIAAMGILAVAAGLAEPVIAAAALVVFGVGLGAYSAVPNFHWLIAMSLVWSQGLHVWMPLPNSMMLSLAEPGRTGRRLGQMQSAGAIGSAVALGAAIILTAVGVHIRPMYVMAGVVAILGAAACLWIPHDIKTPGPRVVFRRKYRLFYAMSFLEGWRKQMSLAFSGFLLVKVYNTSLTAMLVLWMAVQVIQWAASPLVGRIIDRVGERKVLIWYYVLMAGCFGGYILIHNRPALWGLYVVNNAFFMLSMALTTYVRRIAPPAEHTPTLSLGVAMNHVAAVTMPLVGGFLWVAVGYQAAFCVGIVAAIASIVTATFVPRLNRGVEK